MAGSVNNKTLENGQGASYAAAHQSGYVPGASTNTEEASSVGYPSDYRAVVEETSEQSGKSRQAIETGGSPQSEAERYAQAHQAWKPASDSDAKEVAELKNKTSNGEVMSIQQQIDLLKDRMAAYAPEDKKAREKRERMERSKRIVGAVSDGLRALGNLFFTTQYAPNMYNHDKDGMSGSISAAIERAREERARRDDAYYNMATQINTLEGLKARTMREAEERAEKRDKEAKAEERKERDEERKELMWQAKYAVELGRLTYQGYQNAIAEIKAGTIQELTEAQIKRLNRTGTGRLTGKGRRGSEGKGQYADFKDKDGNDVRVKDAVLDDYYLQTSPEVREAYHQENSVGDWKTPTRTEKRLAVGHHLKKIGNTFSQGKKKSPTGVSSGKKKSPTS